MTARLTLLALALLPALPSPLAPACPAPLCLLPGAQNPSFEERTGCAPHAGYPH